MILFTEHDEVILSVSDLREVIRRSFLAGSISDPHTPATFGAETWLRLIEKNLRRNVIPDTT